MWDGAVYYHFARYVSFREPDPLRGEVHNHVSPLFIYLMHVPTALAPGSVSVFNTAVALIGLATVLAFCGLLAWATAGRLSRTEAVLITALFAFHPAILGNWVDLGLDIGVLAFFLLHVLAVVRGQFAGAAAWGICLVLTKETGVLLLPLAVAGLLLVDPARRRAAWLARAAPAVVVPAGRVRGLPALQDDPSRPLALLGGGRDWAPRCRARSSIPSRPMDIWPRSSSSSSSCNSTGS